jgi:hypothetical protein
MSCAEEHRLPNVIRCPLSGHRNFAEVRPLAFPPDAL